MSKREQLENFSGLNAFGLSYQQCLESGLAAEKSRAFHGDANQAVSVGLSSGTSGRRGVFLTTPQERLRWAATILASARFLSLLEKHRVAFFLRANSPLYSEAGGTRLRFRYFDLSLPFPELASSLRDFAPTALIAPPAVLSLILQSEKAEGRTLEPRVVVSVADRLEPALRAELAAHFGVVVHEVYQATEGFLGITCLEGTLHLNEELFYLEKTNEEASGAFQPQLSDYFRRSQAFVRFHLDDVLLPLAEPCACGSKRLAIREIMGRADDTLLFTSRAGEERKIWPDFVRQAIQNSLHKDLDFRLVQSGAGLELQLAEEVSESCRKEMEAGIRVHLESQNIELPVLTWNFTLARPVGDKRKRVLRT